MIGLFASGTAAWWLSAGVYTLVTGRPARLRRRSRRRMPLRDMAAIAVFRVFAGAGALMIAAAELGRMNVVLAIGGAVVVGSGRALMGVRGLRARRARRLRLEERTDQQVAFTPRPRMWRTRLGIPARWLPGRWRSDRSPGPS